MQPSQDITVIWLERSVPDRWRPGQPVDRGARVTKVERPGVTDFACRYEGTVNGHASCFVRLTAILGAACSRMTAGTLAGRSTAIGIACARLRNPIGLFPRPQHEARDPWRKLEAPDGPVRAPLAPALPGRTVRMGDAPGLGQHKASMRDDAGARA